VQDALPGALQEFSVGYLKGQSRMNTLLALLMWVMIEGIELSEAFIQNCDGWWV